MNFRPIAHLTFIALSFFITGCGSSSGTDAPVIYLTSPGQNETFSPGEPIEYSLETENFVLVEPPSHAHAVLKHHDEDSHSDVEPHEEAPTDDENEDGHDHEASETNPHAQEGHYHIYLDDAAGSEEHVTAWHRSGSFQLPTSLGTGTHSLRFELRDNMHVPIGSAQSETVLFFNIQ